VEEKPGFRGLEKGKTIFFSVKWEKYGDSVTLPGEF
jgi:hypothetical protein